MIRRVFKMKNYKDIWKIAKKAVSTSSFCFSKVLSFCFKSIIVALFLAYFIFGLSALEIIIRKEINRTQNISEFENLVDKNIKLKHLDKIDEWIKYRSVGDTDKIAEVVTKRASDLSPQVFFRVSALKFKKGENDDALFWFNLGKYRLRYDMMRCGGRVSIDKIENFIRVIFELRIDDLYDQEGVILKKSLKRVVEFDKDYPPKNDIEEFCKMVMALEGGEVDDIAEEEWPKIRDEMIKSAEIFVNEKTPASTAKDAAGKSLKDSAKDF